jgi:hypothetical protein
MRGELSEARAVLDAVIQRETVSRIEATVRRDVAKVFVAQGKAAVQALSAYRNEFREVFGDAEIERILAEVFGSTENQLERIIRAGIGVAIAAGFDATQPYAAQFGVSFDRQDPRAQWYLDRAAAARVSRINETTRLALRRTIIDGFANNESYSTIAKRIREQFDGFAGAKPQQHIRDRAELVAVTEIGEAFEESKLIGSRQMQANGLPMEKRWITVGDDRVSDGCQRNQAQGWIRLADNFDSGHERPLRFPGCRCTHSARVAL